MVSKMFHKVDKWFKKSKQKKHILGVRSSASLTTQLLSWLPFFCPPRSLLLTASVRLFYKASRQRGTTSYACHAPWNRSDRKWCDFGTGLICRTTTCWSNILMWFLPTQTVISVLYIFRGSVMFVFYFDHFWRFRKLGYPQIMVKFDHVRLKVGIPFFTKGSSICCIWIPQVFPLARPPNLGDTVEKSTSWWAKSHFLKGFNMF